MFGREKRRRNGDERRGGESRRSRGSDMYGRRDGCSSDRDLWNGRKRARRVRRQVRGQSGGATAHGGRRSRCVSGCGCGSVELRCVGEGSQ